MSDAFAERVLLSMLNVVSFVLGTGIGMYIVAANDRDEARAMTERMERLVERENKVRWMEEEIAKKAKKREGKWK